MFLSREDMTALHDIQTDLASTNEIKLKVDSQAEQAGCWDCEGTCKAECKSECKVNCSTTCETYCTGFGYGNNP